MCGNTKTPSPVYGAASVVKKPCGHTIWLIRVYTNATTFFMGDLRTVLTVTAEVVCSCFMIKVILWLSADY